MQPWINDFLEPARYKIAYGGRGSGKSWGIARILLYLVSVQNAPIRVLCAREYQASIADSVHRLLSDTIRELELPGFSITRTDIMHQNGASFFFRGLARNPHSIKSAEGIDIVWIEEAHAVSEDSWRQLVPTIRKPDSEIWISFNPRYLDDPTCQRFYGQNAPAGAIVREVNHDSNPWFPDILREEMRLDFERDPELAMHIWEGKPLQFSSAQVLKGKWSIGEVNPHGWSGPFYGVDFGVTDPTAAVECWLRDGTLYIAAEKYARGVENLPAFLAGMKGLRDHNAYADSAWPETIQSLKRAGFGRIYPAEKWPGSVDDGIVWLRSLKQIIINPACKRLAEEATLWRWKTDLQGNPLPKLADGNEHGWDAVRYAMGGYIKQRAAPPPASMRLIS